MRIGRSRYLQAPLAALLAFACPSETWAQLSDHLIVPGRRIGSVSLGMTAANLLRLRGDPRHTERYADASVYEFGDGVKVFVSDKSGKVFRICVVSTDYALASALSVGDSDLAIKAKLPPPKKAVAYHEVGARELRWDGMFLTVDRQEHVQTICVI